MNTSRQFARFLLCAALVTSVALPAFADHTLRVAVVDPGSRQELAVVNEGTEITMSPGQTLTFRLFEPQGTRKRDRAQVPAIFGFGNNPTPLEIVSTDERRGEVTVRLRDAQPGQRYHLGWRLRDNTRGATSENTGKVNIRVVGAALAPAQEYYVPGYRSYGTQVDAIVDAFYRGILMRDAEVGGSEGWRESIARGDYEAVRRAAVDIARSPESMRLTRESRASAEQRLSALYEHLLGMSAYDVDPRQWDADLARIQRGDIAGVVSDMVSSQAFQYRYGYLTGRR